MKSYIFRILLALLLFPLMNTLQAQVSIQAEPGTMKKEIEQKATPIMLKRAMVLRMEGKLLQNHTIILDSIVEFMKKDSNCKLQISGHWDNQCTNKEAEEKSNEISSIVVNYLTKKGIIRRRLLDVGFGARMPARDNRTVEGRKANRRVVLEIIP